MEVYVIIINTVIKNTFALTRPNRFFSQQKCLSWVLPTQVGEVVGSLCARPSTGRTAAIKDEVAPSFIPIENEINLHKRPQHKKRHRTNTQSVQQSSRRRIHLAKGATARHAPFGILRLHRDARHAFGVHFQILKWNNPLSLYGLGAQLVEIPFYFYYRSSCNCETSVLFRIYCDFCNFCFCMAPARNNIQHPSVDASTFSVTDDIQVWCAFFHRS